MMFSILVLGISGCDSGKEPATSPSLDAKYEGGQVAEEGDVVTLKITSNSEWSVTKAEQDTWITAIDPENGNGDKEVKVTIAKNDGDARTATLTVSLSNGDLSREVSITQAAAAIDTDIFELEKIDASYFGYPFPELLQGNYSLFFSLTHPDTGEMFELIYIDLNAEVTDRDTLLPADGTYEGALSGDMNTFNIGWQRSDGYWASSAYIPLVQEGPEYYYPVDGGTVTVSHTGDTYTIYMDLTVAMHDRQERVKARYVGEIEVTDRRVPEPEPPFSNLTKDVFFTGFDSEFSEISYWGEVSGEASDSWFIALLSDDAVVDDEDGLVSGKFVTLDINAARATTHPVTTMPDGRYNVRGGYEPNTIVPGWMNTLFDEYSWYFEYKDFEMIAAGPISTGYMDFTQDGDQYTCAFRFKDDLDFRIEGDFSGTLNFLDGTEEDYSVYAKAPARAGMRIGTPDRHPGVPRRLKLGRR